MSDPNLVDEIVDLQTLTVPAWHTLPDGFAWETVATVARTEPISWALKNHYHNYCCWHHEDQARTGIPEKVVAAKRGIDLHNQARNDAIERLDELLTLWQADQSAPVNTETIGSTLDRLSILSLRIYHLGELAAADNRHEEKLRLAIRQHGLLRTCAGQLWADMLAGRRCCRPFAQLKLYNSPDTNPLLAQDYFAGVK